MSGFPWTSLITAVVPAAAVLAGAALTGRQNNQAGQTAALKADYAGFVQAVTALIERLDGTANRSDDVGPAGVQQLVSAVALARALVDLAGSYGARKTASDVWEAALRATAATERADWARKVRESPAAAPVGESLAAAAKDSDRKRDDLRLALEDFLKAVRGEVGGESRPGLKWMIRNFLPWNRRHKRPAGPTDNEGQLPTF